MSGQESEDRQRGGPPGSARALEPERLHWATPVIRAVERPDGVFEPRDMVGTSFPLGGDLMLTASHVARAALDKGDHLILARPLGGGRGAAYEGGLFVDWPEIDLAAIQAPGIGLNAAAWDVTNLRLWQQVRTIGFPFGLDHSDYEVTIRGLAGHIVALKPFKKFTPRPWVYELSFQAPRGLSGAPLLLADREVPVVGGCIVGNEQSFMEVSYQEEEVTNPPGRLVERRVEGMYYAVAITAAEILRLRLSPTVTLEQHIRAHGGQITGGRIGPPQLYPAPDSTLT